MRAPPVILAGALLSFALAATAALAQGNPSRAAPADEVVRPFDRITLKNGNVVEGTIDSPGDWKLLDEIEVKVKGSSAQVKLKSSDIESVIARQTPADVYKRKLKRIGEMREPKPRAREELALGRWCKTPLEELDGAKPQEAAAIKHFLRAVEVDASLAEAYPHILSELAAGGEVDFDREARVAVLAGKSGHTDPEIDYRIATQLLERPGLEDRALACLERVIASPPENEGLLREARRRLAEVHRSRGKPEKAMALYQAAIVQPETDPRNFEPLYELAKMHARMGAADHTRAARELFARALAIQPDFAEIPAELAALDFQAGNFLGAEKVLRSIVEKDPANVSAAVDLSLVRVRLGRFAIAEKKLNELLARAEGAEKARAHLALANLSENKGREAEALGHYRAALEADPGSPEARVGMALALIRASRPADARGIAASLLAQSQENRWLFAACSRLLGEADLAEGRKDSALSHFLRAVEVDATDPALLERVGVLFLHHGKPDAGFEILRRARQAGGDRPDTLNALGYYHYGRGEYTEAKKLFDAVLKAVKAPPKGTTAKDGEKKTAPVVPPARLYALRARALIDDLDRLQIWAADLGGPDGPTLNGWEETERFGIDIARKDGKIVLAGKQAGAADGVTQVFLDRPVEVGTFERVAASARIDSGKVRFGLRLEGVSSKGGASAGLVVFRDLDGMVRCQVKTTVGDWEPVAKTVDIEPDSGKTANPETAAWPEDGAFHALEIRRSAKLGATRAAGGFDVYFDGEPIIWNVKVTGLGGRQYDVGISGQTEALGNDYSVTVESFKVYRIKPRSTSHARF